MSIQLPEDIWMSIKRFSSPSYPFHCELRDKMSNRQWVNKTEEDSTLSHLCLRKTYFKTHQTINEYFNDNEHTELWFQCVLDTQPIVRNSIYDGDDTYEENDILNDSTIHDIPRLITILRYYFFNKTTELHKYVSTYGMVCWT